MYSAALSDVEIISRCQSGALLDDIDRFDIDGIEASLLDRSVSLHNAGQIDLLALTQTAQFNSLSTSEFFVRQDFFCKAIPRLQTQALLLMQAVKALVVRGGADLMANRPYEAFRDWCAADRTRSDAIIAAAEAGDVQASAFVTFAFTALGDATLARSFVEKHSDERRLSAMFALGRIKPVDVVDAEDSISVLLPFVDAAYDETPRYNALMSLLNICCQYLDLAAVYLPKAIVAATVSPTPGLQFNLARALWLHAKLFDRSSIKYMLDALKTVDPALGGVVNEVDQALKTLLETPNGDLALHFLCEILARDDGFELKQFKSVRHDLASGDRDRLFRLLVRWLSTDNSNLGVAAQQIVTAGEHAAPFQNTTGDLGLNGADHIFLAYKTLGWLFLNDVVAASILVACLRGCDRATAKIIGSLLFDPLLLNYGGKAFEYLKTIKNGDLAHGPVKAALKAAAAYAKGLEIDQPIKELRPSEYQRSVERRHAHDVMRKIRKDAEKHSVLFNLVHRSVLLYGRRSITYVQEPGRKRRPVSMDLHSFSHSFELPRCEVIDPVGLSVMLLTLRSVRRK
ncbi:hypothetical protein [Tardiphaga sp.]|uniref:hypothetical protein n=1 Tax=Tardiphaga sp. TaxID=1926292 RepID=UPI002632EE81|nr:hypothetical protein [Tardiphaga sp.]MDB5620248.1 hypothetical protein [Tardiphaga sp.]